MTLYLDVNESGGWRRVMSFENDDVVLGNVMLNAGQLLSASSRRIRARIIESQGTTAPMYLWTQSDGWHEWETRADRD